MPKLSMESIGDGEDFLTGERAKKIIKEKLADVTEQTVQDFKDLTDKWNHKVDINVRQDGDEIIVSTEDKAFLYLSNGTATHRVEPIEKQRGALQFPVGYEDWKVKSFGEEGHTAYSKGHIVSGIFARRYEKYLADKAKPRMEQREWRDFSWSLGGNKPG